MDKEPRLGCKAHELEVGTEFSCDCGLTWLVVRTEPTYVSEAPDCLTLRFMASDEDHPNLGAWEEVRLEDSAHVFLEKNWRG